MKAINERPVKPRGRLPVHAPVFPCFFASQLRDFVRACWTSAGVAGGLSGFPAYTVYSLPFLSLCSGMTLT